MSNRFVTAIVTAAAMVCTASGAVPAAATQKFDAAAALIGHSEKEIGEVAAAQSLDELRQQYQLPAHFTDLDVRTAGGIAEIASLRKKYGLSADFNSADLVAPMGTAYVTWNYREVSPNGSFGELCKSMAIRDLQTVSRQHPGLAVDFEYDDYLRVLGNEEAAYIASQYGLPDNFSYADIVRIDGPSAAAHLRKFYDLSKNSAHAEIVYALGLWKAKRAIDGSWNFDYLNFALPKGAGHEEVLRASTTAECSKFRLRVSFSIDETLVSVFGRDAVASYANALKISLNFSAADVQKAAGEQAVQLLRDQYDLEPQFSDKDIADAAAANARAVERRNMNLSPGFSAEDDAAARKRLFGSQAK